MAKIYDVCKLCGKKRFLNFMGLCKRCSKDPKAHEIVEKAINKHQADLAIAAEDAAKQEAQEAQEAEEVAKEEQPSTGDTASSEAEKGASEQKAEPVKKNT